MQPYHLSYWTARLINNDVKIHLSCNLAVFPVTLEKGHHLEMLPLLTGHDNDR